MKPREFKKKQKKTEKVVNREHVLCVLIMSHTCFRGNLHSAVA